MPKEYKSAVQKIKADLIAKGVPAEEAERRAHAIATSKNIGNVKEVRRKEKKHRKPGRERSRRKGGK